MDLEIDIKRLRKQFQVLDRPQGDRLMANMVQSRLREQEDKAIDLLQQAVDTEVGQTSEVQLRLLIAERAHQFGGLAEPLANSLRHLALDGWLQIGAGQQA